jgi:hypothetical protein
MSQYTPEQLRAMASELERLRPGSPIASLFLTTPIPRFKNGTSNNRPSQIVAAKRG